jgi:hypothetical protein
MIQGKYFQTLRELVDWLNNNNISKKNIISLLTINDGFAVVFETTYENRK